MNAAEFIADSGFSVAIGLLANAPETASHYSNDDGYYYEEWSHNGWVKSVNNQWVDCKKGKDLICLSDLKKYVGAHMAVKEHGSLGRAKEYAESAYTAPEIAEPLKKAIALVEEVECFKEVC